MVILIISYLIGYFITIFFLSIFGERMGLGGYDEPRTYVNFDDYDSNAQAWTFWSMGWPIFSIVLLFFGLIKGMLKLSEIIINKYKK